MRYSWLLAIFLIVARGPCWAGEALFGGEFEFSNSSLASGGGSTASTAKNRKARDALARKISERCQQRNNCKVTRSPRKWLLGFDYKVTYDDGWSFRISTDPQVVEIQTFPQTRAQFQARAKQIQSDIFDLAVEVGLIPGRNTAGHIHMGVESAFRGNATLFRNYLVDQVNHAELSMGVLGDDINNAPTIGDLTFAQQKEFKAVIREFDQGEYATITELAQAIEKRVYTASIKFAPPRKYQQQNVTRIVDYPDQPEMQTLEDRAISGQRDFEDFLRQIRMKQARLDMLEKIDGRVELEILSRRGFSLSEKLERFKAYTEEPKLLFAEPGGSSPELKYRLRVLPHTERTKRDYKNQGLPPTRSCLGLFAQLRARLNPKRLLFFSY